MSDPATISASSSPARAEHAPAVRQAAGCRADGYQRCFVWLVWAVMTSALGLWIGKYGRGLPLCDDWTFVGDLCSPTLSFAWLCEQVGYSRLFLGKFLMWAVWQASGGDVRAGMLFGGAVQSITAAGMIAVTRRLRGTTAYSDAFFPILLLNWSIAASLAWFMLLGMFAGMFLFYNVFLLLVAGGKRPVHLLPIACLSLILLPLIGSLGVIYVPFLTLGMLSLAVVEIPGLRPLRSFASLSVMTAVAIGLTLTALYFVGFRSSSVVVGQQGSIPEMLLRVLECAGKGLGWSRYPQWLPRWLPGVAAAALTAAALGLLVRTTEGRGRRFLTLLFAAAATWAFPAIIGFSRPGVDGAPWYLVMTAPVWCLVYLLWCMAESGELARLVQMALFAVACSLAVHQLAAGTDLGMERREALHDFERDVAAGVPVTGLVARHANYWKWNQPDPLMTQGLLAMRSQGVQPFAAIADDPPWRTESVQMQHMAPTETAAAMPYPWTGDMQVKAYYTFPQPRFVRAIRLLIDADPPDRPAGWRRRSFRVVWLCEAGPPGWLGYEQVECQRILSAEGGPVTVWVNRAIKGFCVQTGDKDFPPFQTVLLTEAGDAAASKGD